MSAGTVPRVQYYRLETQFCENRRADLQQDVIHSRHSDKLGRRRIQPLGNRNHIYEKVLASNNFIDLEFFRPVIKYGHLDCPYMVEEFGYPLSLGWAEAMVEKYDFTDHVIYIKKNTGTSGVRNCVPWPHIMGNWNVSIFSTNVSFPGIR